MVWWGKIPAKRRGCGGTEIEVGKTLKNRNQGFGIGRGEN